MFTKIISKTLIAATSVLFAKAVICSSKKNQSYIWGNGRYQARPDALLQFHNFYPKKISNLPSDLVQLFFGEYYEAGLDRQGQLYVWQKYEVDSNFNQNKKDHSRQGIRVIQKDVKQVKFTAGYIWTLDKNNKVYQWPILKKYDKDNQLLEKKIGQKRQVEPLKGSIQIEAGRDHVITLNDKGEVYAMGDDTFGQCGQAESDRNTCPPFTQKRIKYPIKVKNLSQITQIAAGGDHNLALDRGGNLYGWGSNSNLQLSHESQFSKMNNPLICSYAAIKISKNLDHVKIKKIVAGSQFSVVVGQNKQNGSCQLFSFGTNLRGQLGINETKHFNDVCKIQKLSNYVIKVKGVNKKVEIDDIKCGQGHCLALLNIGYVMEWGDNQFGQLGNKKRSPSLLPILIRDFIDKKVISISAGQTNSGVIVEEEPQK